MNSEIKKNEVFPLNEFEFEKNALLIFSAQYHKVPIYRHFVDMMGIEMSQIDSLQKIPFLPIQFFKTHRICDPFSSNELMFESSGTTGISTSTHYIHSKQLYEDSIINSFVSAYGDPKDYIFLALLPHYLERKNSSLVYMVQHLMMHSSLPNEQGFFLNNFDALEKKMHSLQKENKKIILFGVTFALIDFFEEMNSSFENLIVIETGGMKGKRAEMPKQAFYDLLSVKMPRKNIHSEYGMTELLSPSFSKFNGIYNPPNSLKVMVRDVSDPKSFKSMGKGVLNIIDLANRYSCSFIATDDIGEVFQDGSFEVYGRLDQADMRGCNLLYH